MNTYILVIVLLIIVIRIDAQCTDEGIINGTRPTYRRTVRKLRNLFRSMTNFTPASLEHLQRNTLRLIRRYRKKTNNTIKNLC